MNLFALSGLLVAINSFSFGIFSWVKGKRFLNKIWAVFNLSVAIWGLGAYKFSATLDKSEVFFWLRLGHIGVVMMPVLFLHFVFELLEIKKIKLLYFLYGIGVFFSILNLTDWIGITKLFIVNLRYVFNSFYVDSPPGFLYPFFVFFFFGAVIYAHYLGVKCFKVSVGSKQMQIKYFLFATAIGFTGGGTAFLMVFNMDMYPLLHFTVATYPIIMTYAILKHNLMDINIALTRAGIFLFVYSFVLGVPFWLGYATKSWFPATALAVVLATAGPFIYQYLRQQAEAILLKEQKQYQKAMLAISSNMLLIKELGRLLKTIVSNIVDIVRVSWAGIYLQDEKSRKYVLRYKQAREGEVRLPEEFLGESELVRHLLSSRMPIIGEEAMSSHFKIGLAAPCSVDELMLGFILLGDKPRSAAYTQDDVNVFTILANQTALAIENCQFYHQQKQYQHSLRTASLDRQMASMVHEIDNPIQGICGSVESLGMILDEVERHIPEEKLKYARTKLERVLFNAKRISNMIGVVRDYSKPTAGEFILEALQDILEGVHLIMQPQFKHANIDYLQDIPKETVWLRANKVELEQVLVNLATNSVQAIEEAWAAVANTPETNRRITLKAYKMDGNILRIDFSDTGSGIKREVLEDIFLDFVTTKASSVGTGLGLSISRKIIQRHKGRMWAESEGENKGAVFHIELPIPADITEEEIKKAQEQKLNKKRRIVF